MEEIARCSVLVSNEVNEKIAEKLVSVIVPCYNEEKGLEIFYNEIVKVMATIENYAFEVLFIDDGSKDKTLELAKKISDLDDRFKYVSFSRNYGKEAGMLAGLEHSKGDYVVIMDADLQDPPSLLPEMIGILESGYDSAATRRCNRIGEPPIRSFFARMFYRVMNKMSQVELVDGARDYRMMTRQMVDSILELKEYHRFTKGIFSWVGFSTKWIEYENIERAAGETKWSFWKLCIYAIDGIVAFSTAPLRFASICGIIISLLAFLYTAFVVIKTIVLGIDVPGYASMVSLILFLGGIQLFSMGILGEYLSRTYMETKRRPKYIVKVSNTNKNKL